MKAYLKSLGGLVGRVIVALVVALAFMGLMFYAGLKLIGF